MASSPSIPIVNSGRYRIKNVLYGAIRDDDGALGAKGNSTTPELEWDVVRNGDGTYTLTTVDPNASASANPGGVISEIEKRFYISIESSVQDPTKWRLQPILQGSNPPIVFVIYQDPRDNPSCPDLGHWELNNSNKKEPVKLNRDPNDEENKPVPSLYDGNAIWTFEYIPGPGPKQPPTY